MPDDSDRGAFSADIPEDAIADAVAAVERQRARRSDAGPAEPAREVEVALEAGQGEPPAQDPDRVRLELAASRERERELSDQLRQEHDRLLRAAADLENQRKRAARERDEVQRYGVERLVKELLPVLDNLERALAAAPSDDPLAAGVALTRRLLEEALGRFGVKGFSARGERFDPRVHEALMTVATDAHAPGTVLDEQQRGYFLHDRLVRPAAVVVAAAPPSDGEGAS